MALALGGRAYDVTPCLVARQINAKLVLALASALALVAKPPCCVLLAGICTAIIVDAAASEAFKFAVGIQCTAS